MSLRALALLSVAASSAGAAALPALPFQHLGGTEHTLERLPVDKPPPPPPLHELFPIHAPQWAKFPRSAWRLQEQYPAEVSTDSSKLRKIMARSTFLSSGDASWYYRYFGGRETANTEPFRRDDMTAAIVGYHSSNGCFAYLPKAMGGGYPLLVVVDGTDGVTRWAFVRINDRGPYGHKRLRPCGWEKGTLNPHPDRIIDLSRGAARAFMEHRAQKKLSNKELFAIGVLRNVRLYLPPPELLPEAKVRWDAEESVRESVTDLLEKYPPMPDPGRWLPPPPAAAD
jgi:hypothetical protein